MINKDMHVFYYLSSSYAKKIGKTENVSSIYYMCAKEKKNHYYIMC